MEKQLAQGDKDLETLIRQWQPKEMKERSWTSANYCWWKIQTEEQDRRQSYNWLRPTWQHKRISSRVSELTRHQGWRNRDGGVPMALIYSDIKSHFNMSELTLNDLMEILIVTGKKKARWGGLV